MVENRDRHIFISQRIDSPKLRNFVAKDVEPPTLGQHSQDFAYDRDSLRKYLSLYKIIFRFELQEMCNAFYSFIELSYLLKNMIFHIIMHVI